MQAPLQQVKLQKSWPLGQQKPYSCSTQLCVLLSQQLLLQQVVPFGQQWSPQE
jgi:hypothetical protein